MPPHVASSPSSRQTRRVMGSRPGGRVRGRQGHGRRFLRSSQVSSRFHRTSFVPSASTPAPPAPPAPSRRGRIQQQQRQQRQRQQEQEERTRRLRMEGGMLRLLSASVVLPHPSKLPSGGEDAHFISSRAAAVLDGVSSSTRRGASAARFAKHLCSNLQQVIQSFRHTTMYNGRHEGTTSISTLPHAAATALSHTHERGAATLCAATLNAGIGKDDILTVMNVGDSMCMVIREGKMIFRTRAQCRGFNTPLQLSFRRPWDLGLADVSEVLVRSGDVIILASDGFADNVYDDVIMKMVDVHSRLWSSPSRIEASHKNSFNLLRRVSSGVFSMHGAQLQQSRQALPHSPGRAIEALAMELAALAMQNAHGKKRTPFADVARRNRIPYVGGKPDDITVVVAVVTASKHRLESATRVGLASSRRPYHR